MSLESSRLAKSECEISPGYDVRQKATPFHKSSTKAVACDHPQKRCELPLFFAELVAAIGQAVRRWKALDLGSLDMQFQQDWPKDKKLLLLIFCRKTEKFRSTEL